jgi:hypothetical protein
MDVGHIQARPTGGPPSSWPTPNLASGWLQSLGTGSGALGSSSALTFNDPPRSLDTDTGLGRFIARVRPRPAG